MRWRKNIPPQVVSYRVTKRFALIPIETGAEVAWLETVYVIEKYEFDLMAHRCASWFSDRFTTREAYEEFMKRTDRHQRWMVPCDFAEFIEEVDT